MGRSIRAGLMALALAAPLAAQSRQPPPLGTCSSPATNPNVAIERRSVYVPMPDGKRMAVDVFLPQGLASATRLPTVFVSTRYWRAAQGQQPGPTEQFWLSRGYAYVYADVRGTGASFGQWYYPWSPQEVQDIGHLIGWVAKQPWSNGRVGSIGTSYTGNTAQLAAATGNPAVKAVVPRFMDFDVYSDLTYPGGVINRFIINDWGKMVHAMDLNQKRGNPPVGVRPVDGDQDDVLLASAIRDHQANPPLDQTIDDVNYRDDEVKQFGGVSNDLSGTYRYRAQVEASGVPIFGWASWLDAGTSQGLVNRFMNWKNQQLAVVGPWSHGGGNHASPYFPADKPTEPPSAQQTEQSACFFDRFLKGNAKPTGEKTLIYYTLAEDKWKKTSVWPIPGTTMRRFFLDERNTLAAKPPSQPGKDRYRVDFDVTTGTHNRWYTQLGGGDVIYDERSAMDQRLLSYTSAPLDHDVEVTGQGIITLRVSSTATDGNFFVYLEDVMPDGQVIYVTEGMLRALHRKLSSTPGPYQTTYPYRTYMKKDGEPLVPGQPATLKFQLIPTSVLFKQGHRIRISIAGADKDTFLRNPAQGDVTITVERGGTGGSMIELPVVAVQRPEARGQRPESKVQR